MESRDAADRSRLFPATAELGANQIRSWLVLYKDLLICFLKPSLLEVQDLVGEEYFPEDVDAWRCPFFQVR